MATSANQQGVVGADSGAIWMWTEACVILRGYSPFKMTFCFVDLLRRHLFLSFYNASPLLSTFSLISPACLLSSRCATRGQCKQKDAFGPEAITEPSRHGDDDRKADHIPDHNRIE